MKKIRLTQGKYALVDNLDYKYLCKSKWFAEYRNNTNSYIARRKIKINNGKWKNQLMHRVIMNAPKGIQVDHINHDTLDNRKANLRLCTQTQNSMNRLTQSHSSKYKGVTWHKLAKKWVARIRVNKLLIPLGYFKLEKDAADAYDKVAKKYFGNYAYTNI